MDLMIVFISGLTTGGLSCLAVQGGLLASLIANQKKQTIDVQNEQIKPNSDIKTVSVFLLAKLIVHTLAGFALGGLGSVVELSLSTRIFFQLFTALFMLATAANMLDLHPALRYLAFQPPSFARRLLRRASQNQNMFAPFVLGLLTIFIPCGVTQAMEVTAIATGSPVQGALILFTFIAGTIPLFASIGLATAKLSDQWQKKFSMVAASLLVFMSLYSINGVLQVIDAPVSMQKIVSTYQKLQKYERDSEGKYLVEVKEGTQKVEIEVESTGYKPAYFQVRVGVPVEITLRSQNVYSCASAFTFRAFDIYANLKPTDMQTYTLIPDKKGKYSFSCSMGMYTGVMEVI